LDCLQRKKPAGFLSERIPDQRDALTLPPIFCFVVVVGICRLFIIED
jgi:hypothetical protein